MSLRRMLGVRLSLLAVGAGLLLCPPFVLAQFGAGTGGHVGPNTSGGVDEKDGLKGFHQAIALQATAEQTAEFQAVVKSAAAASGEFEELRKTLESGSDGAAASERTAALRGAIERARMDCRKFVEGFSAAQKAGLRESAARVLKAEAELGEQEKIPGGNGADAKAGGAASLEQGIGTALANFRKEEDGLAVEMGILQIEGGQDVAFRIPAYKSSVKIGGLPVEVTTSAVILRSGSAGGENIFRVVTTSDLTDLQQNMLEILRAGIRPVRTVRRADRGGRCDAHAFHAGE